MNADIRARVEAGFCEQTSQTLAEYLMEGASNPF